MMVRFSIAGVESVGGATRCEAFVMVDKINDSGIYWAFKENLLQCQYMNKQKKKSIAYSVVRMKLIDL